eukprot:1890046-Pyramimonas_sp.AAC.1
MAKRSISMPNTKATPINWMNVCLEAKSSRTPFVPDSGASCGFRICKPGITRTTVPREYAAMKYMKPATLFRKELSCARA